MANFSHARIVIFCGLCFLSSCDKPARLKAEQEELTAQAAAMKKELTELDAKLKAVGSGASNYIAALERQAQEAVAKAEADELAVSSKVQKLARIEASVKELRSKVDAWKAKYRK
jgi:chromosome segregation ATPase